MWGLARKGWLSQRRQGRLGTRSGIEPDRRRQLGWHAAVVPSEPEPGSWWRRDGGGASRSAPGAARNGDQGTSQGVATGPGDTTDGLGKFLIAFGLEGRHRCDRTWTGGIAAASGGPFGAGHMLTPIPVIAADGETRRLACTRDSGGLATGGINLGHSCSGSGRGCRGSSQRSCGTPGRSCCGRKGSCGTPDRSCSGREGITGG